VGLGSPDLGAGQDVDPDSLVPDGPDLGVDPDEPDRDVGPVLADADASGTEEHVAPDEADSGPDVDTDSAEPGGVRCTEAESDAPGA